MSLLGLLLVLAVVALLLGPRVGWAPAAMNIVNVLVAIVVIVFVLELLGVFTGPVLFGTPHLHRC